MLRFTHIYEIARQRMGLTRDEYALCNYIATWASHPKSTRAGWCDRTFQQKADFIGITKRGVIKMQQRLAAIDLIETDPLTSYTRTTVAWFNAVLDAKNAEHDEQSSPRYDEQSSPSKGTKFTATDEQSSLDPMNNVHPHNYVSNNDLNNDFVLIDSDASISVLTPVEIVVGHLNSVLKPARPYSTKTKATILHVNARIAAGFTADDICKVIDYKFEEWFGDPKMEQFIRPDTLFGTGKFESYLVAAENWIQRGKPSLKNNNNRHNGKPTINDDKSFAGAFK